MVQTSKELPVAARPEAARFSKELGAAMALAFEHGMQVAVHQDRGLSATDAIASPAVAKIERAVRDAGHGLVCYLDDYAVLRARARKPPEGAPE